MVAQAFQREITSFLKGLTQTSKLQQLWFTQVSPQAKQKAHKKQPLEKVKTL